MENNAWLMRWLSFKDFKTEVVTFLACLAVLCLGSLLRFKIAISPIPLSALTFLVGLLSLSIGGARAMGVVFVFLIYRSIQPLFSANGFSGAPEIGYLVGMVISSLIIGKFSEAGFANSFLRILGILYVGSAVVLLSGAAGMSFLVSGNELFAKAVSPFLVGDLIKNVLCSILFIKISAYVSL